MYTQKYRLIVFILVVALLLVGCAQPLPEASGGLQDVVPQATEPAVPAAQEPSPQSPAEPTPAEGSPAEVALRFYSEYVAFSNEFIPTLGNPEFTAQELLSPEYLEQVRQIKAGFEGSGFDPILGAQAVPPAPVKVQDEQINGDQAQVTLSFGEGLLQDPWLLVVSLDRIDGEWKLVPTRGDSPSLSPMETVDAFYRWYLDYIGTGEDFRNPMVDKAYRAAPYLLPSLVGSVDRSLESGEVHSDPFLCAQDIPSEMKATTVFNNNGRPSVLVESSFPGHYLTADLVRIGFNQWGIARINCGGTSTGLARAFYTWLLGYASQGGEPRNPWTEGAYQDSPFLHPDFIQMVSDLLTSAEGLVADPALLAQDLPQAFNTAPGPDESSAYVHLQFGDSTILQLLVESAPGDYPLRIRSISRAESAEVPQPGQEGKGVENWVPLQDGQYGYALRYPAGWQPQGLQVTSLRSPQDDPLVRSLSFNTPLDTGRVSPFSLDVALGDDFIEARYPGLTLVEEKEINGVTAQVYSADPGIRYYIFQHPYRAGEWLVITDFISDFPGREETAQRLAGVFEAMLSTLTFLP